MRRILLEGRTFGSWTVLDRLPGSLARCRCECGTEKLVQINNLRRGVTSSCGCRKRRLAADRHRTHNRSGTSIYNIWCSMKQRCLNSNHQAYPNYGGRGISICDEWVQSFEAFLADVGERPGATHTLDRIDNDGDYRPGNVRWATASEQRRNQRPTKVGGVPS